MSDAPPHPGQHVSLPAGVLTLWVEHAELPLEDLCGYASRRSHKRGFVFVSKVLGKHYPVRPRRMEAVHARLAAKLIHVEGPTVVVGMAETAIGLGQGVYEQLLRLTGRYDILFTHTTRYRLNQPVALDFDESHSHATEHLLYQPDSPTAADLFYNATSLVLVDDELSTGQTLGKLARAYRLLNRRLRAVHIVSLTEWLGAEGREQVADCAAASSSRPGPTSTPAPSRTSPAPASPRTPT
jgi:hypothetical protein